MKVLYSTPSVVEYDGRHYYSSPVQVTFKRYLTLGEDVTVLSYIKRTNKPKNDLVDDGAVNFVFAKKVNTLKGLLKQEGRDNEQLVDKEQLL